MKEGTHDIPAIKFKVACNYNGMNVNGTPYGDSANLKEFDFDQVDGLTVEQFLRIYNVLKENSIFSLHAYLDCTEGHRPDSRFEYDILRLAVQATPSELDTEISKYFEDKLLMLLNNRMILGSGDIYSDYFTPEEIVSTYCARYRARDNEFINQRVLKK